MDVFLMIIVNTPGSHDTTFSPLLHAHWDGFTLTDLVFPTFLFVVGASLSFSFKAYESAGTSTVLRKVLKRTAVIFLLGYLLYWFPFVMKNEAGDLIMRPIGDTRIFGVLQRIALCYCFAALLIYFVKIRAAVMVSVVLLILYWFLMTTFGDLTLLGNAVLRLDHWLLGDRHLYHGEGVPFDPEGLLSTIPAIVNVVAGYCTGLFLKEKGPTYETIARMMMAGFVLVFLGLAWDLSFPLNKKLWTSSFVLLTSGIDVMVLAILVFIIDVRQWRGGTYFFEVFGRNTLFIYLLSEVLAIALSIIIIDGNNLFDLIFAKGFESWAGGYFGSLFFAISFALVCWSVGYWMDRRKVYVKI